MMSQREQRWWEDVSTYRSFADRDPVSPPSELEEIQLPEHMTNQDLEEGRDTSYDPLNPQQQNEEEDDPDLVSISQHAPDYLNH